MEISRMNEQCFTWQLWRSGTPLEIGLACRQNVLIANKALLQKYTIGFCNADNLLCRPKADHKAVMIQKDALLFWFHITNKEFEKIYET